MGGQDSRSLARRRVLGLLASTPFIGKVKAFGGAAGQLNVEETDSTVTVGNDLIEVTVGREQGGIRQLRSVGSGLTLREPNDGREATHWQLTFYSDEYEVVRSDSRNSKPPAIEVTEGPDRATVLLRWSDAELVSPTEGVIGQFTGTVVTRIQLEAASPTVQWQFEVRNGGELAIRSAACPMVNGVGALDPRGEDELVVPKGIGRRSTNPTETDGQGIGYPSSAGTMQFTAYTGASGGFYTAARDTRGHAKQLLWHKRDDSTLTYRLKHFTPHQPGQDVSIPYPATIGVVDGDWYDAAERYREWLLEEGWLPTESADLPDWTHEVGAVFKLVSYTRPDSPGPLPVIPYEEVVVRMQALSEHVNAPLGIQWNGWQRYGEPAGLDWFPPKEGRDAFEESVRSLDQHDVDVLAIYTVVLALERSDFWQTNPDRIRDWLVRTEDGSRVEPGSPEDDDYNEYLLEFPQQGLQRELRSRLRTLAQTGVRDFQIDGFPNMWVPTCYAEHHDHPPGFGGNWFPRKSRAALREMRRTVRSEQPDFVLSGEGFSDYYLPFLQAGEFGDAAAEQKALVPESQDADIVPVLPYTLGEFLTIREDTVYAKRDSDYQRVVAGRALVWGTVPRAHVPPLAEDLGLDYPILDYLGRVARARSTYGNRFVARGEMLRQPTVEVETVTMEIESVRGGTDAVQVWTPAILTNAWRSGRGETGLLFTNVAPDDEARTVDVDLLAQPMSLPEKPWLIYTVHNGEYGLTTDGSTDRTTVTLELEQSDVILLVVAPANTVRTEALAAIVDAQEDAVDAEQEAVDSAKRSFEADDLEDAMATAEEVLQSDPSPPSSTDTATRESETEQTAGDTSIETPGFTSLSALAGIGTALASRLLGDNEGD